MSFSFKLKLFRNDVAVGSLPTVSESSILSPPVFSRKSLEECTNDVKVQYVQRVGFEIPSIVSMSVDYDIWLVTMSDGRVYCWGDGNDGLIGDGNDEDRQSPTLAIGDFAYAGVYQEQAFGLTTDGRSFGWGDNTYGTIGNGNCYSVCDGDITHYNEPTEVGSYEGEFAFSMVRKGGWHALGIKPDGTMLGWGYQYGGSPAPPQSESGLGPVKVGPTGYMAQFPEQEYLEKTDWYWCWCGWNFSHAIDTSGRLWATGSNGCSNLGLPDTNDNNSTFFVQVGTDTDWVKVRCGDCQTVAQKSNGDLYGFGYNQSGCLGGLVSMSTNLYTPTKFPDFSGSEVVDFCCGAYATFVLKTDGTLWSTGENGSGQLGLGSFTADQNVFQQVVGGHFFTKIADQAYDHMMAATADGSVYAWGYWQPYPPDPPGWLDHTPNLINFNFIEGA